MSTADYEEIRSALVNAGVVALVNLSTAIIDMEGGMGTAEGRAALRSFLGAMGDPRHRKREGLPGKLPHITFLSDERGPTRVAEYLQHLYPGDNGRLAVFIESIGEMAGHGIESDFYREVCHQDVRTLLTLVLQTYPKVYEYYTDVTCGKVSPQEFWDKYPQKVTAGINLFPSTSRITATNKATSAPPESPAAMTVRWQNSITNVPRLVEGGGFAVRENPSAPRGGSKER